MLKIDELKDPQSCLNKAKDDERLFVLLERDPAAPHAIRAWVYHRISYGKNKWEDPQIQEALKCARLMEEAVQRAHSESARDSGNKDNGNA